MRVVTDGQYDGYFAEAATEAGKSSCLRRRCGSVVVSGDGVVIGRGYNSPAGGAAGRCFVEKSVYHPKVTDKTCCVHAEQRAVFDALRRHADAVPGASLFFCSIGSDGGLLSSEEPYCTICSKTVFDVGIAAFVLFREDGAVVYPAEEYNRVSFLYSG